MRFLSRLFQAIRAAFRPPYQERDWATFNQHSHRRTNTLEPDWAAINSYVHWPVDTWYPWEPDWAAFNQHAHC